jgi:hypothetical protein
MAGFKRRIANRRLLVREQPSAEAMRFDGDPASVPVLTDDVGGRDGRNAPPPAVLDVKR